MEIYEITFLYTHNFFCAFTFLFHNLSFCVCQSIYNSLIFRFYSLRKFAHTHRYIIRTHILDLLITTSTLSRIYFFQIRLLTTFLLFSFWHSTQLFFLLFHVLLLYVCVRVFVAGWLIAAAKLVYLTRWCIQCCFCIYHCLTHCYNIRNK